jgi:glycosyltransferase involved in cell wall biosynthesis
MNSRSLPRISVVTPSFNQGLYLESTLMSVLSQDYPALEYVVVDGGSTDGSVEILRRHSERLSYWVSERDGGQYDAINKAFARTSGEIMAWLNSDDLYLPSTLAIVGEVFASLPEVQWLTTRYPIILDANGRHVRCDTAGGFNARAFFRGMNLPGRGWAARPWIQQESTFWRRGLWERSGGRVDASLRLAGDFELWARFFRHADLYALAAPLAGFRQHEAQKTACRIKEYAKEAERVLRQNGGRPYGGLSRRAHHLLRRVVGNRTLDGLPQRIGSFLSLAGILYPVKICAWTGHRWATHSDYIV